MVSVIVFLMKYILPSSIMIDVVHKLKANRSKIIGCEDLFVAT